MGLPLRDLAILSDDAGTGPASKQQTAYRAELLEKQEQVWQAYLKRCETDYYCFVRGLKIASQTGPQRFEACAADFQRKCLQDIAPSLRALQLGEMPPIPRWWIERTKKASKDADLATIVAWLIGFAVRPFYAQIGAADKTQAAIVKERIVHQLHWNAWLNDYIEVVQWEVRSRKTMLNGEPMAKLHIMSSDISGAHGGTPDMLIVNELSHVTKWEFVQNLMDNADGVAQGMIIIATNAGFKGTQAEVWRNEALRNPRWSVHIWDKPAPWHNKVAIEEAKQRNPPSRFKRLWKGVWVSGRGDALDETDIDRAMTMDGPDMEPIPGVSYLLSLDLGVKHDRCGVTVLGVDYRRQKVRVAFWRRWSPRSDTGEVDLMSVEDECLLLYRRYGCRGLYYDPHQAKLMAQRLRSQSVRTVEVTFTPANLISMADALMQLMKNGRLECYDDDDGCMRTDFGKFDIVEKSYGYRLEAVRDEMGHADVGTALVIGLPMALALLGGQAVSFGPEDALVYEDDEELTDKEVEAMPSELRDIYELDEVDPEDPFDDYE